MQQQWARVKVQWSGRPHATACPPSYGIVLCTVVRHTPSYGPHRRMAWHRAPSYGPHRRMAWHGVAPGWHGRNHHRAQHTPAIPTTRITIIIKFDRNKIFLTKESWSFSTFGILALLGLHFIPFHPIRFWWTTNLRGLRPLPTYLLPTYLESDYLFSCQHPCPSGCQHRYRQCVTYPGHPGNHLASLVTTEYVPLGTHCLPLGIIGHPWASDIWQQLKPLIVAKTCNPLKSTLYDIELLCAGCQKL